MTGLDTAITELNTDIVKFVYPNGGRTTEGEVVIFLKRLKEFEKYGLEPDEIGDIIKFYLTVAPKFLNKLL